jgi:hypothetical protein
MKQSKYSKIKVYAVLYEKDTNGKFVLDSNGEKIIIKSYDEINSSDNYTIITDISEQYVDE